MSPASAASSRLARAVSILGHPLLVLPFSILLPTAGDGIGAWHAWRLALAFGLFAGVVMAYSWWQVRRQRWRHVDASNAAERRSLNRFLLLALLLAAPLAWMGGLHALAMGLSMSALVIVAAILTTRWWTLSLHVAFAVFAAMALLRAGAWACAAGLGFAVLVAWSRLQLARHALRDVVAGAVAGAVASIAFWQWSITWRT